MKDFIQKKLTQALAPSLIEVIDESSLHARATSSHFRLLIVSEKFSGLTSLQRHQKVYQILGPEVMEKIHAFSQQTFTSHEWTTQGVKADSPPCVRSKT